MNISLGKAIGIGLILMFVLGVLGECLSTGPPIDARVIERQIQIVNQSLDVLHEEIAASRSPSRWPLIFFAFTILAPLLAAIWLLWRAESSVIAHDKVIRVMTQAGLGEAIVKAYLMDPLWQPRLPGFGQRRQLIRRQCQRGRRRRRQKRRWRQRKQIEREATDQSENIYSDLVNFAPAQKSSVELSALTEESEASPATSSRNLDHLQRDQD